MPSSFPSVNTFSSVAEFGSLRGGVGRGILQTRVPREGCWGPDGVTRDGGYEVRGCWEGIRPVHFFRQWESLLLANLKCVEIGEVGVGGNVWV